MLADNKTMKLYSYTTCVQLRPTTVTCHINGAGANYYNNAKISDENKSRITNK
jgi:hypothetical protein